MICVYNDRQVARYRWKITQWKHGKPWFDINFMALPDCVLLQTCSASGGQEKISSDSFGLSGSAIWPSPESVSLYDMDIIWFHLISRNDWYLYFLSCSWFLWISHDVTWQPAWSVINMSILSLLQLGSCSRAISEDKAEKMFLQAVVVVSGNVS